MDALLPAFVAALVAQAGDRPPWLAAILGDRFSRTGTLLVALALAHALGFALAAAGAMLVAPMLTPEARQMLLAFALLAAGAGALWPMRPPHRLNGWRIGAFATAFGGIFILALGDRTQFLAFALGVRTPAPVPAALAALVATVIVNTLAVNLGEQGWRRLPIRPFQIVSGALFLLVGSIAALGALRLI